jgi:hypothetical protein
MSVLKERRRNWFISHKAQRQHRVLRTRLFLLPPLLICLFPPLLAADCQVELATGAIVTCTGVDLDGVATGALNDTVTVAAGAIVSKTDEKTVDTTATADAVTINGGDGNNTVTNGGAVDATATATANPANSTLSQAMANAIALQTGDGLDTLSSTSGITATATSLAHSSDVSVTLAGADSTQGSTLSEATAIGIFAGGGADTLTNFDHITTSATATASALNVDLKIMGLSSSDASTTAHANAIGMAGGNGADTITNHHQINATSLATVLATGVTVSGLQLDFASPTDAGIEAVAEAFGITGDGGDDTLNNTGAITANSTATATTTGIEVQFAGLSETKTATTAQATATGITGLSGSDTISNSGAITAAAIATASATGVSVSALHVALGTPENAGVEAIAQAYGLSGGTGDDSLTNTGSIATTGTATASATNVDVQAVSLSSAIASTLAESTAIGIDGGEGGRFDHQL